MAAIHRVSVTDLGPSDPWYHEPVGADRWDELVALESWIEPPQMLRTCHRGLWADNVVPTADGGVCVIDWENSGPADPDQELGCVLFEFARADSAAWIGEVLDEPHTRELLETLLGAGRGGAKPSRQPGEI